MQRAGVWHQGEGVERKPLSGCRFSLQSLVPLLIPGNGEACPPARGWPWSVNIPQQGSSGWWAGGGQHPWAQHPRARSCHLAPRWPSAEPPGERSPSALPPGALTPALTLPSTVFCAAAADGAGAVLPCEAGNPLERNRLLHLLEKSPVWRGQGLYCSGTEILRRAKEPWGSLDGLI